MATHFLDEDLVRIRGDRLDGFAQEEKPNRVVKILYWGDAVDLVDLAQVADDARRVRLDAGDAADPGVRDIRVRYYDYARGAVRDGVIRKRRKSGNNLPLGLRAEGAVRPLAVTFVDVQQGDATLIRTPAGRHLLVDGGEEVFIARLLASEFPATTAADPFVLDALVISHGDADHFVGLSELADAAAISTARKRIHTKVARCFHNGLVKKPEKIDDGAGGTRSLKERERFGEPIASSGVHAGQHYIAALHDDPRLAADPNTPFTRWNAALGQLLMTPAEAAAVGAAPGEVLPALRRLEAGDDAAFASFADDGLRVEVLGPVSEQVAGETVLEVLRDDGGSQSASHTINGHSVILRLVLGKVRLLLGGDLNRDGSAKVLAAANAADPPRSLEAEVLKVPHHGSHDFASDFLASVAPVISVVSSGDENAGKEYVHPRANLMAALGRHSRGPEPLIFSTELSAFFAYRGGIQPERHRISGIAIEDLPASQQRGFFFAFERLRFGVIRVRTDGERVFVAPESASDSVKEAYAFRVADDGAIIADEPRVI